LDLEFEILLALSKLLSSFVFETLRVFETIKPVIGLCLGSFSMPSLHVFPPPAILVCLTEDPPTSAGRRCKIPELSLGTFGTLDSLRAVLLSEELTSDFIGDLDLAADLAHKVLLLGIAGARLDAEVGGFLGILYEAKDG
jgi:hypothetical protein